MTKPPEPPKPPAADIYAPDDAYGGFPAALPPIIYQHGGTTALYPIARALDRAYRNALADLLYAHMSAQAYQAALRQPRPPRPPRPRRSQVPNATKPRKGQLDYENNQRSTLNRRA